MEKIYYKLWEGLNRIQKGTLKDGITEFSKTIGLEMEFLLLNVIAFLKVDENLARHAIKRTVD